MPDHIGRITLKGAAAEKLLKSVGNTMSASVSGEVESAAVEEDFDEERVEPVPGQKPKPRPKVPIVHIDITGISNISNPSHQPLKKVMGEE